METREMSHKCCAGFGRKHKKMFIVLGGFVLLAIIVISVGAVGWKIKQARNQGGMMLGFNGGFERGQMMNRGKGFYPTPLPTSPESQFMLPGDALKSGELAVVVGGLDSAKKAVSDIALENAGNVYATFISYTSNDVKNGTIVVQVPAENFDKTFDELKKVGSSVVQESTRQIPVNNYYAVPMSASTEGTVSVQTPASTSGNVGDSAPAVDAKPEIAIYPAPGQIVQNKGYVKIVFADYGKTVKVSEKNERREVVGNILGIGNPANENMRNNLLVIIGVKLIFLVAILGLLVVVFKKIFHAVKKRKENKARVHVVRQLSKTHKRVVKIQTKKKK